MKTYVLDVIRRRWLFLLVATLVVVPLAAWAQQEVLMTGQDSSGNTRVARVDSNGNLGTNVVHGACTNTTMNVGTTGTPCPATQLSNRSSIVIQLVQSGETMNVTTDGMTTATATAGINVVSGGTYSDNLAGSVAPSCRCSAATCSVRIVECP